MPTTQIGAVRRLSVSSALCPFTFFLSQRKDGRFSARFRSKTGKRIEKYFDTLPQARNWLDNLLTGKPVIFAANVGEDDFADDGASNEYVKKVREYAKELRSLDGYA